MKYKTCVYAICKNEEKFIKRWYDSIKESDYVCILDTGSTDNSINIIKELNIKYKKKIIKPFRFDTARNESMKLIPKDTDICICLDLDEVMEKGWKEKLDKIWDTNLNRLNYIYNWKLKNNIPKVTFYANKIHSLKKYKWIHPVHEILKYDKNENIKTTNEIVINHYPDENKSRKQYLKLLELAVKENPTNDRNMHYLGREYMYNKKWNKSIDTLIKHLNLKTATWNEERCASMRFISRCYTALKRYDEAKMWLDKAINECKDSRDPLVERMILEYSLNNYYEAIYYGKSALKITNKKLSYINEIFSWDETIYDVLSICYYKLNQKKEGLNYLKQAININPSNKRLKNNLKFFI